MKKLILAAAILLAGATSNAQVTESFAGLNPADLPGSTSSIPSATWGAPFGGTDFGVINDAAGDFPLATDGFFARYGGNTDQLLNLASPTALSTGPIVQFSFAVRVNNLPADPANATIELVAVRGTNSASSANAFVGVSTFQGDLELGVWNNFTLVVAPDAFDVTATGTNWNDGQWRLIAVRAVTDAANGSVEVRVYSGPNFDTTPLVASETGIANARVALTVTNVDFGLRNSFPDALRDAIVDIDEVTVYPETVNIFTEIEGSTSVSDWNMFQ